LHSTDCIRQYINVTSTNKILLTTPKVAE